MKLDRLETHDRLQYLHKDQSLNISKGAEDCLKRNKLSLAIQEHSPYIYIFAHPRTSEDGITKRMIWQVRLTRPTPQTNSYLFRAISKTDNMEICWLLPPRETWKQYERGNITEHEIVLWSIRQFINNRIQLGQSLPDDLSDEQARAIYIKVASEMDEEKRMNEIKQDS
jgi:hypothetical protein